MNKDYILAIDQSTQGTKALLFNGAGQMVERADISHQQLINKDGWVSHNLTEIYQNTIAVVKTVIEASGVDKDRIVGVGISNQRETAAVWERETGRPLADAIVWQCARATDICKEIETGNNSEKIRERTGIHLSPYFPAAKWAWYLAHVPGVRGGVDEQKVCLGTIDSFLMYCLTGGEAFKTDYSNASRTQLFNLEALRWDEDICNMFGIPISALATVCDSDACFGATDFDGYFTNPIPIHSVLGDSHGALLGQGCLERGMIKTTYGTGSSVMMNIGEQPIISNCGVVTSLAWKRNGKVNYVLEGNINYTGGVITWLKDDMELIRNPGESEEYAQKADQDDTCYLVPAFTGLSAPYWDSQAKACIVGMTRGTKKAEVIRAGLDCIAYQIADVVMAMSRESQLPIRELRVDGGPTKNRYLMQFQSDILNAKILVPDAEELSAIGVAYAAGIALGIYPEELFENINRKEFQSAMSKDCREKKYAGWLGAVTSVLMKDRKDGL